MHLIAYIYLLIIVLFVIFIPVGLFKIGEGFAEQDDPEILSDETLKL